MAAEVMVNVQSLHVSIIVVFVAISVIILEVHVGTEQAFNVGAVVNLSMSVDSHTSIKVILGAAVSFVFFIPLHTSVAGPGDVTNLSFEVGYANTEVVQFVSIFASEFVNGSSLFSVELIFVSHQASDDLSEFITGNVSLATECAVRVTFNDTLVGQLGNCLVSPVRCGNIREWICCVCGYASGQCCYCSDCENLLHSRYSPLNKFCPFLFRSL